MKYNLGKKFLLKLGSLKLEEGKNFNRKYELQYEKRKNIEKNYFLLNNFFGINKYMKRDSNNQLVIPEDYYLNEKRTKLKLNIYNYQKTFENLKKIAKITTQEDELLEKLLYRIDSKNTGELLKKKEKMINLQKKIFKGFSQNNWLLTFNTSTNKSLNKTNSITSFKNINNRSNYKSNISTNFNNSSSSKLLKNFNSLSIDTMSNTSNYNSLRNDPLPTGFRTKIVSQKLQNIFNSINKEEKILKKASNILSYNMSINRNKNYIKNKMNIKSHSTNFDKRNDKDNIIRNIGKLKRKNDLEKLLFTHDQILFKNIKHKLHTLYKKGKKIPQKYLEEE